MDNFWHLLKRMVFPLLFITAGITLGVYGFMENQNTFFILGAAGLFFVGVVMLILMLVYESIPALVFKLLLVLLVPVIGYYIFQDFKSINDPIVFQRTYEKRADVIKVRLTDIRDAQVAYLSMHGRFTADFDTLIDFINNGKLKMVKKINTTPKELLELKSESQLIKEGYIRFDTAYVTVLDSIFKGREDFVVENIAYIPFTDPKKKFKMNSGKVNKSGIMVPVFEVEADKNDYLADIKEGNEELLKDEKILTLIIGSMFEPTRDGNWE